MRHGLGASPVRIVLMPSHDAAVSRGLAEQLIVPKSDCAAEQLAGRHEERRIPQDVVECGSQSPRARR